MTNNALMTIQQPEAFETLTRMAGAMVKSGYFKDAAAVAQAVVKIQAGYELGLPPFASMTGIHIIQGKPTLGSNVIATLVKNDPRYDYRVEVCNDEVCRLQWRENGQAAGYSEFTIAEAKTAGLTNKQTWKAYPSDMLFARAISRGARRFAPGIFGGSPVYTADEMGADVDPDGYIEGEVVDEPTTPEPPNDNGQAPAEPEPERTVAAINKDLFGDDGKPAVDWTAKALAARSATEFMSAAAFAVDGYTSEHHIRAALQKHADWDADAFDQAAAADWLRWLKERKDGDDA